MAQNSFLGHAPFLTLDSSDPASIAIHRENKPAHFVNTLSTELRLEGNAWMCALMECRVPKTFRTISDPTQLFILVKPQSVSKGYETRFSNRVEMKDHYYQEFADFNKLEIYDYPPDSSGFLAYEIPTGVYSSPRQLAKNMEKELNNLLQGSNLKVISYERPNHTVAFRVFGGEMGIWSKKMTVLSDYFGWKSASYNESTFGDEPFKIAGVAHIDSVLTDPSLMQPLEPYSNVDVFCDAIATYSMGSQQVNHLATVPMHGVVKGETVVYTPSPHIYYPVSRNNMREIEVKVCRRNGELVNFMGGDSDRVSLKLHFKQQFLQ